MHIRVCLGISSLVYSTFHTQLCWLNVKLHTFSLAADFGPATHSLNMIKLYRGMEIELTNLDFSRFSKLKTLITGVNPIYKFPASNLPQSRNKFVLNVAYLTEMTNFSRYTPIISIVNLGVNNISTIKEEFIQGLHKLRQFSIGANRLHAIPDLYDKPLEILQINGNPIRCDVSLCWVRLWARMKLVSLTGADPTVCHLPPSLVGKNLLHIDPAELKCYKGNWEFLYMLEWTCSRFEWERFSKLQINCLYHYK